MVVGDITAAQPPLAVGRVVDAATKGGLLAATDFSDKTLTPAELASLRKEIARQDWIAEIPKLEPTLLANYPAVIGIHKHSGFRLAIHYLGDDIMLLGCSVPVVNGDQKEQTAMIETMLASTEALVGRGTEVRTWLDTEWKKSWNLCYKEGVDRREVIRKKQFGAFLVTVWGVPPDIIFLNCVRAANQAAEPTSPAVTPPADAGDRASGARGSP